MNRYAKLDLGIKELEKLGFQDVARELRTKVIAAFPYKHLLSVSPFKKKYALAFEKEMNAEADKLGLAYKHSWTEIVGDQLKKWLENESVPMRRALWEGADVGMRKHPDGSIQLGFKATSGPDTGWMPLKGELYKDEKEAEDRAKGWGQKADGQFKDTLEKLKAEIAKEMQAKVAAKPEEKPEEAPKA